MPYRNKRDWILKFVRNKKVLDLGCVQHSLDKTQGPNWLHGFIAKHAQSTLGVDIRQREVDALKQSGYNVVCADVEQMDLKDEFEVIVAGDLIEHLSNPGAFMDRVFKHLAPGGLFLMTTPNPITLMRFLQLFLTGRIGVNPEHTCWFTPQVVNELARRSHLQVIDLAYVDDTYQYYSTRSILWWPLLMTNFVICRIRAQVSETLCFVLQQMPLAD